MISLECFDVLCSVFSHNWVDWWIGTQDLYDWFKLRIFFSAKHVWHVNYGMQYISHESDEILMKKHVGRLVKLFFIPQVLLERRPL